MKKRLHTMKNEKAFYLPYVLIVSVITLSLLTTSIVIYQNEMKITQYLMEQVEVETLIQMGREQFKKDLVHNFTHNGKVNYEFPNGLVQISYQFMEEVVELQFDVLTANEFSFEIIHQLPIENMNKEFNY